MSVTRRRFLGLLPAAVIGAKLAPLLPEVAPVVWPTTYPDQNFAAYLRVEEMRQMYPEAEAVAFLTNEILHYRAIERANR
jgi:hypothetical protein